MSDAKELGVLVYEMKAFLQEAAGDYSLWNKTPARELIGLLDALAAENAKLREALEKLRDAIFIPGSDGTAAVTFALALADATLRPTVQPSGERT